MVDSMIVPLLYSVLLHHSVSLLLNLVRLRSRLAGSSAPSRENMCSRHHESIYPASQRKRKKERESKRQKYQL